ncbi:hypothetical protein BC834DRAFT_904949 [Gloeopeniophorella convolvens]|nr:hypothetical protein BC834DRAFT_904949 [Gloeopeniophorella convolvens]
MCPIPFTPRPAADPPLTVPPSQAPQATAALQDILQGQQRTAAALISLLAAEREQFERSAREHAQEMAHVSTLAQALLRSVPDVQARIAKLSDAPLPERAQRRAEADEAAASLLRLADGIASAAGLRFSPPPSPYANYVPPGWTWVPGDSTRPAYEPAPAPGSWSAGFTHAPRLFHSTIPASTRSSASAIPPGATPGARSVHWPSELDMPIDSWSPGQWYPGLAPPPPPHVPMSVPPPANNNSWGAPATSGWNSAPAPAGTPWGMRAGSAWGGAPAPAPNPWPWAAASMPTLSPTPSPPPSPPLPPAGYPPFRTHPPPCGAGLFGPRSPRSPMRTPHPPTPPAPSPPRSPPPRLPSPRSPSPLSTPSRLSTIPENPPPALTLGPSPATSSASVPTPGQAWRLPAFASTRTDGDGLYTAPSTWYNLHMSQAQPPSAPSTTDDGSFIPSVSASSTSGASPTRSVVSFEGTADVFELDTAAPPRALRADPTERPAPSERTQTALEPRLVPPATVQMPAPGRDTALTFVCAFFDMLKRTFAAPPALELTYGGFEVSFRTASVPFRASPATTPLLGAEDAGDAADASGERTFTLLPLPANAPLHRYVRDLARVRIDIAVLGDAEGTEALEARVRAEQEAVQRWVRRVCAAAGSLSIADPAFSPRK